MKNHRKSKVSFVKTFHKTIDKLFTNVYNMSCENFIKKPKKSCNCSEPPSGSLLVIVQNRESKNLFYSDLLLLCG